MQSAKAMMWQNNSTDPYCTSLDLPAEAGFCVLMSVYIKEDPSFFAAAMHSIYCQTLLPDQIVLVCDGPLTPQLEEVISEYQDRRPGVLTPVRLPQNGGLGNALNQGMKACRYELIARMDSDDYSYPNRFEKQYNFMRAHPKVDLLNCSIDEFCTTPDAPIAKRCLPQTDNELKRFAKKRCPVNHPSVMYRKSAVLRAGGYLPFYLFEDYYLWARMIMAGCRMYSLQESLLAFRMNHDTYLRRMGIKYARSEMHLQRKFREIGFVSRSEYIRNLFLRVPPRIFPYRIVRLLYKMLLRKPADNPGVLVCPAQRQTASAYVPPR